MVVSGAGRGAAAQRGSFGGSQRQQQPRSRETPSAQQLREWYARRGRSGGAGPCTYVLHTGSRRGETCGLPHTAQRCFGHLTDAWHAQFLTLAEGDCYLSVPPDLGIAAAALGASASAAAGTGVSAAPGAGESALSGTAPTKALHTFTLESGASRSLFRDSTTLTPLSRPVAVSWLTPMGAQSLRTLPRFYPDLQDAWVDKFALRGQRMTHCTCSRTGRHLATFTRRPGSSLYTLTTAPHPVSPSGQVAASSQVFAAVSRSSPASAPCSCRPLTHETLLWHHRLGHPSLPRLRVMASHTLVSGLPRCLPPLPPGPAPICVPCVEGRQRTVPHSSSFPPTEAPLQTLHMDVWGPARVRGQGHERYFVLVVDEYSCYTSVFPLRSKGDVTEVLIDWIRGTRRQLSESFGLDLPVLRLHSDRGGEFSSDLLTAFCRAEGIRQTFTLLASPQQNGIAERRIGMVMDVARTSMIHAAAPHFLWPFAGPAPSGVSQVDPAEPVEVAVDSGAARGTEPAGAGTGGAEPERVEPGGADSGGAASWGAEPACAESGGSPVTSAGAAGPGGVRTGGTGAAGAGAVGGAASTGAPGGAAGARAAGGAACAGAAGGTAGTRAAGGAAGAGAAGGAACAGATGGAASAGATGGAGPAGGAAGAGAAGGAPGTGATRGAAGAGAAGGASGDGAAGGGTGVVSAVSGGAARPRPYYVSLLQRVLGLPPSPVHSQSPLQPSSPLPGPSPYSGPSRGLTERHPESDSLRAASPTVTRFLATAVIDPLFESSAASALVAKLVEFAAACRLD
ncbi:unnamed protein product [Closterium sp. NIES-54]